MPQENKDDFIEELKAIGKQSKSEYDTQYSLLTEELREAVDQGILPKRTLKALKENQPKPKQKKPRTIKAQKGVIEKPSAPVIEESDEPFEFIASKIYVREFLPAIVSGIPSIVKGIIGKHLVWSEIDIRKVGIDKAMDDKRGAMCISNVYYRTPNGNRFKVNLKDIYNILLKIDFE